MFCNRTISNFKYTPLKSNSFLNNEKLDFWKAQNVNFLNGSFLNFLNFNLVIYIDNRKTKRYLKKKWKIYSEKYLLNYPTASRSQFSTINLEIRSKFLSVLSLLIKLMSRLFSTVINMSKFPLRCILTAIITPQLAKGSKRNVFGLGRRVHADIFNYAANFTLALRSVALHLVSTGWDVSTVSRRDLDARYSIVQE